MDGGGGSALLVPTRDGRGPAPGRGGQPGRCRGPARCRRLVGGRPSLRDRAAEPIRGELMRGLEGRVALVTGAGGGIGSAVARRLAEEGSAVVCTDLDLGAAELVAERIRGLGGRAIAV